MRKSLAGFAILAAVCANASAMIIDHFNTGNLSLTAFTSGPLNVTGEEAATVLGGYRGGDITITGGPSGLSASVIVLPAQDNLAYSNDATVTSIGTMIYDGIGSTGLGGIDITGEAAFSMYVFSLNISVDWKMTVEDTSNLTKVGTMTIPNLTANQWFFMPFSSLTGTADLTQVDKITVSFTSNSSVFASDLRVDLIGTGIPEPGTLSLLGLGLLAAVRRYRRR